MSNLYKDEQQIYDALSHITVDATKLEEQVKKRLQEEPQRAAPRRMRHTVILAAALSVLLVFGVAAAAVMGKFDWLMENINPSFGEIVEKVELASEDQGIRMELIAAQKYDNKAIVYLSFQDVSGANRLTEKTDLFGGFYVGMEKEPLSKENPTSGGFGYSQNLLHFDKDSNTIYYEIQIEADESSPLSDPLTLGSSKISFSLEGQRDVPMSLSLTDLGEAKTMVVQDGNIWGRGGVDAPEYLGEKNELLATGYYAEMPHGRDDQWVSNIGFIDGQLHIQIGQLFNQEFGSSSANLSLMKSNGERLRSAYDYNLLAYEDDSLFDMNAERGYGDAKYKYNEFFFDITPEELQDYALYYDGSVKSGVSGRWSITAHLADASDQMRIVDNDIVIENHQFSHITISPLGLQIIGNYEGDNCLALDMTVAVETADGIIDLHGGGGSQNEKDRSFCLNWGSKKPLDVSAITAILIEGVRIPVE